MKVDENDFRRAYAELSDEGLLSINREDLVDSAKRSFDHESAERGLQHEYVIAEIPASIHDDFVRAATFLFPDEAEVVRGLLSSGDILCYLENEQMLTKVWPWNFVFSGEDLAFEPDMAAPHGSTEQKADKIHHRGRSRRRARRMLVISILLSPSFPCFL